VGGEQRGYDGGKKARSRKRHLLVHTVYDRERDLGGEYALLSEHFYYFGDLRSEK